MALSFFTQNSHGFLRKERDIYEKKITIAPTIWRTLKVKQKFWAVIGKILYKVGYLKD